MRNDATNADRGMAKCRARVTRDWTAAAQLDAAVDHPEYHFVTGYAPIKLRDEAGARAAMDRMRNAAGAGSTPRLLIAGK
jgi:hypothetical protein